MIAGGTLGRGERLAVGALAATRAERGSDPERRVKGPRLSSGATIAIPSPASPASSAAADWLEASGYRLVYAPAAAEPRERARLLAEAFANPEVGAIVCNGDASTSAELLRYLDYELIASHPKPFVGSGDTTVLHAAFARASGLVTFWGPLLPDVSRDEFTRGALLRALTSFEPHGDFDRNSAGRALVPGIAEGVLVGGSAVALSSLMGTPWEPETRGRILLLAAPEQPWRIHGPLLHLANAGKLQECSGLFVTGIDPEGAAAELVDAVLRPVGIPAVVATGGGSRLPTVPLGARARLDAYAGRLELLEAGVR